MIGSIAAGIALPLHQFDTLRADRLGLWRKPSSSRAKAANDQGSMALVLGRAPLARWRFSNPAKRASAVRPRNCAVVRDVAGLLTAIARTWDQKPRRST